MSRKQRRERVKPTKQRTAHGDSLVRPSKVGQFGHEVRRRRLALGMSLVELAARAKLTPNYLGAIEANRRRRGPSLEVALAITQGLGVELGELLGVKAQMIGPTALEAARLVEVMPDSVREIVLPLLRLLAQQQGWGHSPSGESASSSSEEADRPSQQVDREERLADPAFSAGADQEKGEAERPSR